MTNQEKMDRIAQENSLALIYLFGSQIRTGRDILNGAGRELANPLTDIDIGVVFTGDLPAPRDRVHLYGSICNDLEEIFAPYPVDLVFLQETHSVFQGNVICGTCLYSSSAETRERYEENVLRRAADFRPFLEKYLDELLEEGASITGKACPNGRIPEQARSPVPSGVRRGTV